MYSAKVTQTAAVKHLRVMVKGESPVYGKASRGESSGGDSPWDLL